MTFKMTIKLGDDVHEMSDEERNAFYGNDRAGLEKLLEIKGGLSALFYMVETNSKYKGKRIEFILEFEDGQYVVIGRKPQEGINYGT